MTAAQAITDARDAVHELRSSAAVSSGPGDRGQVPG